MNETTEFSESPNRASMFRGLNRLCVYLSSGREELSAQKIIAREAVLALRLAPILYSPTFDLEESFATYRIFVEQAHICVFLLAQSYGYEIPSLGMSRLEDEIRIAGAKPGFVYVLNSGTIGRDPRLAALISSVALIPNFRIREFSTDSDLRDLLREDLLELLSARFGLEVQPSTPTRLADYRQELITRVESERPIARILVQEELKSRTKAGRPLAIAGEPGIGKTFLLSTLAREARSIYISLKGRTLQQVYSYLANVMARTRGQSPRSLPSEEDARAATQLELENGSYLLLIDDVDQNLNVAHSILSLSSFDSRMVFASRNPGDLNLPMNQTYWVPALSRDETNQLLVTRGMIIQPLELRQLHEKSRGNPLYLTYYSSFPEVPLPEELELYHEAIWNQMSPLQKEAANLTALSLFPLSVEDYHTLLNLESRVFHVIMETQELLESCSPVIRWIEDGYNFFHPHFGEFIRKKAGALHTETHYHRKLGAHAYDDRRPISAAYHLSRANDGRAAECLPDAMSLALIHGDWVLVEEFLGLELRIAETNHNAHREAYARYLWAQALREQGRLQESRREVERASELFAQNGESEWKLTVDLWSKLLLVEEGDIAGAFEEHEEAIRRFAGVNPVQEAIAQVNLAYMCLRQSRFRNGVRAAERALELFIELGDDLGIGNALVNLAGYVGALGENELQAQYAIRTIDLARKMNLPRMRAAGLNHLAVTQRRNGDPVAAQRSLEECVIIARQIRSPELEALNLANLGNALLDQDDFEHAEDLYNQSLQIARTQQLRRNEAHALELLSKLKSRSCDYTEAIKYGAEALAVHRKFGESIRIASTANTLGWLYSKVDRHQDAAACFEESATAYRAVDLWEDAAESYEQAAILLNLAGNFEQAGACAASGLSCRLLSRSTGDFGYALGKGNVRASCRGGEGYYRALQATLERDRDVPLAKFMMSFVTHCVVSQLESDRHQLYEAINFLIDLLGQQQLRQNIARAIALSIEHAAGRALEEEQLGRILRRLGAVVDHLYHRELPDGTQVWTVGLGCQSGLIVQVLSTKESIVCRAVASSVALLLLSAQDRIRTDLLDLGEMQEHAFSVHVLTRDEVQGVLDVPEIDDPRHPPAFVSVSGTPWGMKQPPTLVILLEDYGRTEDFDSHPFRGAFAWVLMHIHSRLLCHCLHRNIEEFPSLPRMSRKFCESLLEQTDDKSLGAYPELISLERIAPMVDDYVSSEGDAAEPMIRGVGGRKERRVTSMSKELVDDVPRDVPMNGRDISSDPIDIAIITVIQEEYEAVRALIEDPVLAEGRPSMPNRYSWEVGSVASARGNRPYRVVLAFSGAAGNNMGLVCTLKTIETWSPRYVLLVGIAGGLPEQELIRGDVVVSSHIWGYEYGKVERTFTPRPDLTFVVDVPLVTNAIALASRDKSWIEGVLISPPVEQRKPKVVKGPVASGEKVIDDVSSDFFAGVLRHWPKLQAIEMEGLGAALAIQTAREDGRSVGFVMIRGISDMPRRADEAERLAGAQTGERDAWKAYASATAAQFAIHYVRTAWPLQPAGSGSTVNGS